MNFIRPLALVAVFLCTGLPAGAVNRCVDAQGKTTYSDQACPMSSQGGAIQVKPASGDSTRRAVRTLPPSQVPETVSGRRARVAALDEAIASLSRKIDQDNIEMGKTMDRMYREFAESSKVADKLQSPEASRASVAVSQNHIRSVQQSYGERLRGDHERLDLLKAEREQVLRAK